MGGVDVERTYLHMGEDLGVTAVEVGPEFWATIGQRTDLHPGRMAMQFRFSEDWGSWEIHPAGDEVVYLLEGAMDLILDEGGEHRTVELRGRAAVVVPKGTWHTANVLEPSAALFLTPGAGTVNEKRGPGDSRGEG